MERLYTPWRMKYVTANKTKIDGCVFCHKINESPEKDRENYLVYRGNKTFVILNLYPYNPGHLMILPRTHTDAHGQKK